jgi:hypothetical protein
MTNNNDYSLVFMHLINRLGYEGNSLPQVRYTCNEYSLTEPSIQFSTSENPLIIYDIEVNQEISPLMSQKWIRHSSICSFLYIVVPEIIKSKTETICFEENLENCFIISYKFEKKGANRSVLIDLP